MNMNWLILIAALLGHPVPAAPMESVDLEMIEVLSLRQEQIGPYVAIMETQREVYRERELQRDEDLSEFYDDTLEKLSEVLDPRQMMQFAAILDCLEEENGQTHGAP